MASIDKIYATKEQRYDFYWWCELNLPKALPYFYPWYDDYDSISFYPATNFPQEIDEILFEKCPLDWVQKRLLEQYKSWT